MTSDASLWGCAWTDLLIYHIGSLVDEIIDMGIRQNWDHWDRLVMKCLKTGHHATGTT
jgi:hypothetical protein